MTYAVHSFSPFKMARFGGPPPSKEEWNMIHGPIAQLVELAAHNRLVSGSSPDGTTISEMGKTSYKEQLLMYQAIQGNIGLGKAIEYFTGHSIPVCLPLNDTQKYDLVVDMDGKLSRVSVKTTRYKDADSSYRVELKNSGGSSGKSKIRKFDNKSCDYVFVLTGNNKLYLIPSCEIVAKNAISIGNKYTEYEVFCKQLSDLSED